jgi:hypothetical protein
MGHLDGRITRLEVVSQPSGLLIAMPLERSNPEVYRVSGLDSGPAVMSAAEVDALAGAGYTVLKVVYEHGDKS